MDTLVFILAIVLVALVLQKKILLPSTMTYTAIALMVGYFYPDSFSIFNEENYPNIVFITLPFLIAYDTMNITIDELKENAISIFLLAVVNIVFSISFGILIADFIFPDYGLKFWDLVLLFSIILPTDPAGVSAALSNFKVPHSLKFKIEAESLGNDPIALVIYKIALVMVVATSTGANLLTPLDISLEFLKQIVLAIFIGLIIGYIGYRLLEKFISFEIELSIFLLATLSSFVIAEHLHVSGILSVIVSIAMLNHIILKTKDKVVRDENHHNIKTIFSSISIYANAFLFIALGLIVDFALVGEYFTESIILFIAITIIRAISMFFYMKISTSTHKIKNVSSIRWLRVLSFGGMKGGISVLMVLGLSIIIDYQFANLFQALTFNIVLLATFVNTSILLIEFNKNGKLFEQEAELENNH